MSGYNSDRGDRGERGDRGRARSRSPPPRRDKEMYSLHVRNLDLDTSTEELRELFGKYGSVRDVYIPRDYYTKQPRGFAYIEFGIKTDADAAMAALNGMQVGARDIAVEYARGERKSSQVMRSRDRRSPRGNRYGRSRSRTPPRRRYSRSPPRRRSPSPRRRRRSPSPVARRRSVSPAARRRSPSPVARRRSPSPHYRRRSPSPRRRASPPAAFAGRQFSRSRSRSPRPALYRHLD